MKILHLSQVMPYPLDAGPKVRTYFILRYLTQYNQVTLVSFTRGEQDEQNAHHLRKFLHAVHTVPIHRSRVRDAYFGAKSLLSGESFLILRDDIAAMRLKIRELLERESFDAIHADQLGMAQYALDFPGMRVLDEHNAVWTIVQRMWQNQRFGPIKMLMEREWRALQKYEARVCQQFNHVLTVTEEDARALQSLVPAKPLPLTVVPICMDTASVPRAERRANAKNIICIGGMFYPPNVDGMVWFGREVFPLVQRACPDAEFLVVGARPAAALLQLAKENPRVRVTGYVEETAPLLNESAVFVVPIRAGGGMRVKILDAWARAMPIVSTTIGCEGIQVKKEQNMLVADTPQEFAEAVIRVIQDPMLGQRLAENGYRWVQEQYDWRVVYRKLDAIYR